MLNHGSTSATAAASRRQNAASTATSTSTPRYTFAFTPFLQTTYHHGLSPDRPICKAYSAGHCPLGSRCPDRHVSSSSRDQGGGGGGGFNSLVCKHWLRGLCKKGEGCEFLHEYNLRKMPECNFFLRNGYCSNGDECLYLHIDPRSKLPPCPDYDNRGFCALGPDCPKKHVRRRAVCPYYLAGFCPDGVRGAGCKEGPHPRWTPRAIVAPQVAAEKKAAAEAAAAGGGTEQGEATEFHADGGALPGLPGLLGLSQSGQSTASPGMSPDDYAMGGTGDHDHQHHQHRHPHGDGDEDRALRGDFRGGFNKDKFGGGGRGGGRWRGRGTGRGFRGRGRGDY